jgi:hypothetical protein
VIDEVKGVVKGRGVGEDVGVQKVEQRVQLVQIVLHRRARQQQHVAAPAGRSRAKGSFPIPDIDCSVLFFSFFLHLSLLVFLQVFPFLSWHLTIKK